MLLTNIKHYDSIDHSYLQFGITNLLIAISHCCWPSLATFKLSQAECPHLILVSNSGSCRFSNCHATWWWLIMIDNKGMLDDTGWKWSIIRCKKPRDDCLATILLFQSSRGCVWDIVQPWQHSIFAVEMEVLKTARFGRFWSTSRGSGSLDLLIIFTVLKQILFDPKDLY